MSITGKQKRINKEANTVRRVLASAHAVPIQSHIDATVKAATAEMYSDADVTGMCEHERLEGREDERRDVIAWLDDSEWPSPAQALAAMDILTAIRNGLHRVKR